MSQFFQLHPENPQPRLIHQSVDILRAGGVMVYPTDSTYALGCRMDNKAGRESIRRIRQLDAKHLFTLMCRDLSDIANYAVVNNQMYRFLKAHTPGPYTFILKASGEVPRRLMHSKRRTVGIRVPASPIAQALLQDLNEPLMSVSLHLPADEYPMIDPWDIRDTLQSQVDLVINGGYCGMEPTTVVELVDDVPVVLREGLGPVDSF